MKKINVKKLFLLYTIGLAFFPILSEAGQGQGQGQAKTLSNIDVSNKPLFTGAKAPVNVLFNIDDSGSMGWNWLYDSDRYSKDVFRKMNQSGYGHLRPVYNSISAKNWRYKNSFYQKLFFNPDSKYTTWTDGANGHYPDASLLSSAFTFYKWEDTDHYAGSVKTIGADGYVDLTDKHIKFKVYPQDKVEITEYSYTPFENISQKITLNGSGNFPELDGKTIKELRQNISNWKRYYSTRERAAKAAVGYVVSNTSKNIKMGMTTINNKFFVKIPTGLQSTESHNKSMISTYYSSRAQGGTPLQWAVRASGRYFQGQIHGPSPIEYSCQQNFNILVTDGVWFGSLNYGDQDGDNRTRMLSDVAQYYYSKDLSPLNNDVFPSNFDKATHQHMVTFGVSFGVNGYLKDVDGNGWPNSAPGLSESDNWGSNKIDDLWHSAYNSRGAFLSAGNPKELKDKLLDSISNIQNRVGSLASVAFNTSTLTDSSSIYVSQFKSDKSEWSGDVLSYDLDRGTGI